MSGEVHREYRAVIVIYYGAPLAMYLNVNYVVLENLLLVSVENKKVTMVRWVTITGGLVTMVSWVITITGGMVTIV